MKRSVSFFFLASLLAACSAGSSGLVKVLRTQAGDDVVRVTCEKTGSPIPKAYEFIAAGYLPGVEPGVEISDKEMNKIVWKFSPMDEGYNENDWVKWQNLNKARQEACFGTGDGVIGTSFGPN